MRFKEKGQYLRSFISDESIFIDIMMNVPIIFYTALAADPKSHGLRPAGAEPTDLLGSRLYRIAMAHCLTTRRTLVRGDGSASHEGIFDLGSGEFLRQTTHQGFRGDSCWSRGLAWSLYGYGTCYELTGDARYLNVAEANAEYYLEHMAGDGVPPWDYDAPDAGKLARSQPDSSAAAIAAGGLFNLSRLTQDRIRASAYHAAAMNTIDTLTTTPYLADGDPHWEGILKRGVYHIHKGLGVDESVMWGEF